MSQEMTNDKALVARTQDTRHKTHVQMERYIFFKGRCFHAVLVSLCRMSCDPVSYEMWLK
jgi:hypothetical protein